MLISHIWNETITARVLVIEMPGNHTVTLTPSEALSLLDWLAANREKLEQDEVARRKRNKPS